MSNKNEKIESTMVRDIVIDDKNHIGISRSTRGDAPVCCDIRLFKLIPINGVYDEKFKATPKGIHFTLDRLPDVICGLIDLYEDEYGCAFDKAEAESIIAARNYYENQNMGGGNSGEAVETAESGEAE